MVFQDLYITQALMSTQNSTTKFDQVRFVALLHLDLEECHPMDYPACHTLIPQNFCILSIRLNYLFPIPSLVSFYLIIFIIQPPHETIGGHQF